MASGKMLYGEIRPVIEGNKHPYGVLTKPQKEEYAELNLRRRGVETFHPKLSLPKSKKANCFSISKLLICPFRGLLEA
jgi:hypothetical protein